MEAYIQEMGRAGRDGKYAEALLYHVLHGYVEDSMKTYVNITTKDAFT